MEFKNKPTTPSVLYYLGFLCLIPLLGALLGAIFLVLGIARYKDKWLIIIGSFGILFTIGIYSALFYFSVYGIFSKDMCKGVEPMAQMQLNQLIKEIEFHKLQNGKYPVDLEELVMEEGFNSIYDVTQSLRGNGGEKYQYEYAEEHYTVFSVGCDGIAYTNDDLFPSVKVLDSSKVGFVKELQK